MSDIICPICHQYPYYQYIEELEISNEFYSQRTLIRSIKIFCVYCGHFVEVNYSTSSVKRNAFYPCRYVAEACLCSEFRCKQPITENRIRNGKVAKCISAKKVGIHPLLKESVKLKAKRNRVIDRLRKVLPGLWEYKNGIWERADGVTCEKTSETSFLVHFVWPRKVTELSEIEKGYLENE